MINQVVYSEKDAPDRYTGNTQSILIVNTSTWVLYTISIIFSNVIWLGTGIVFLSLFQLLGHGIENNMKLKTWYNPGLASTLFLFVPIGIYFINYVSTNDLLNGIEWLYAVLVLLASIVISIVLPVQSLKDRETEYVISEWQMKRNEKVINFAKLGGKNERMDS